LLLLHQDKRKETLLVVGIIKILIDYNLKLKPQGTRYNRAQTEGFAAVKLLGK